jgi:hypothetical protein
VHPFEPAVDVDGAGAERVAKRVIRNQVLVRGSPIAGRALVGAGAVAVAAGLRQRHRKPKKFHLSTEKAYRARYQRGWADKSPRQMKRTHVFRKDYFGSKQIDVQKARVQRRNLKPTGRSVVLTGAGKVAIVAGKALPVIAYGYIGMDMIARHSAGERVDVRSELETATFGMSTTEMLSTAADIYSQVELTYQASKVVIEFASSML